MASKSSDQSDKELMRNFKLENEDHTLGTILTHVLNGMPETEFCAYTIKHPTENVLYLRLKVRKGNDVNDVFIKGVTELKKALENVEDKFQKAVNSFNSKSQR